MSDVRKLLLPRRANAKGSDVLGASHDRRALQLLEAVGIFFEDGL
ncbi:hypothetical protein [Burkholderia multivorans]|nr:hypothetical protein [Burkholderia multivorans]